MSYYPHHRDSLKVIVHDGLAYVVYQFQPDEGPALFEVEYPDGRQLGVLTSEPDEMAVAMLLDLRADSEQAYEVAVEAAQVLAPVLDVVEEEAAPEAELVDLVPPTSEAA